ncbi:hypothetical protein E3O19_01375 [Cryobacterium algoritolerans]|uniref:Uncharacterized protein n=1 Tax=Cryobacterium algoritolerans TaxID=1259184 RepID=A0A4R8WX10_9MICO|nr:hypothetical protein [Cryobacterium algoritolerans]TFC20049.1 hypothetical protein E3O19_01375 [Cryobacterium algoritolerans]
MKSSTIVPETTSIETVPADSCPVNWCTTQHGWQDVDERSHSGAPRVLDEFSAGRIEEGSLVTTWHEQCVDDGGPRTVVEISLVASYSSAELLMLADELQILAAKVRAEADEDLAATPTADLAVGDLADYKVTNRSGWEVEPGTLTMAFLCNGDNQPEIPRDRFIITKTAR